jgi:dihydroorotase
MTALLIRGGRVVDPSPGLKDALDHVCDVLIEHGRISKVASSIAVPDGAEVLDATGLVVAPGFIDPHVHLREPGQEYKETVASGTKAAAAGGFTAVACMPNTRPANDERGVTELILTQAARAGFARVYPVACVTKGSKGDEMAEIGELVAAGAVAVTDDGLPVAHPELMRRVLLYTRHFGIPVMQHAEDLKLTGDGVMHEGEWSARLGVPGIPASAEDVMVARDLILVEDTGGRYHLQHLSSARSLELIRQAKAKGLPVTCEASPHHLLLTDQAVADTEFSTDVKMKPPVRSEADRQALIRGLQDGTIDCIATDHAPHHADEKDVEFAVAPFGIVGLETAVSLCLDRLVHPGLITVARLVELMSTAPARILGVPGGTLKEGSVADITLLDLDAPVTVDKTTFHSKGRNTPFHGWTLRGKAVGTILGGRRVWVE